MGEMKLDEDWLLMILEAKRTGVSIEEVRKFLLEKTEKVNRERFCGSVNR